MFGNSSFSFFSASPVRSSSGILIPFFSRSSFVSANVRYFIFGISAPERRKEKENKSPLFGSCGVETA